MDTKRQLHENHALRRLYNSHPLAANRSIIAMKEHGNCKSMSAPFQRQVTETKLDKKLSLLPERSVKGTSKYDPSKFDNIELRDGGFIETDVAVCKTKEARNMTNENTRNQTIINGLRAGVTSAPLMSNSNSFTTNKDQFLRNSTASRISSISVSRLKIQDKHESQTKMASFNNHSQYSARNDASTSLTYENVWLPEINNNNNSNNSNARSDILGPPNVLMFGRWGYRNSKINKRKIPRCWAENHSQSLSIKAKNINEFPTSATGQGNAVSRKGPGSYIKRADPIEQCKAQNVDEGKDLPVAPAATPTLTTEEAATLNASPVSESQKINLKVEIIINSQPEKEEENDKMHHDLRSLSPFSDRNADTPPPQKCVKEESSNIESIKEDEKEKDCQEEQLSETSEYDFKVTDEVSKL